MVACLNRFFIISFAISLLIITNAKDLGYFWQVSDFHYDANYSATGDPNDMCHKNGVSTGNIGDYGNYMCDAPWQLIKVAVQAMNNIQSNPDFILWTGDSVPHVDNKDLNQEKVYTLIGNVTEALVSVFPNTTIYPVLGNHDPYPSNMMPYNVDQTKYYNSILEKSKWNSLLGNNESAQFLNGGYYSSQISKKLRVIGLNTNLYYSQNKLTKNVPDPANQLQWLSEELTEAQKKHENVYIVAHVPPGVFELVEDMSWFYPDYNKKLLAVLKKFSDIIVAQMYGHEHTDSFRILFDENTKPVSSLFLSPAVTPWKSTLAGVGANNPSIRLYQYERESGVLQKYMQYYLNLTEANIKSMASDWQLEYDTSDVYGLDELRPQKLHNLVKAFSTKENKLFKHYLDYNSVKWGTDEECNGTCFLRHVCAIAELDIDNYKSCMTGSKTTSHPGSTTPGHHHHHSTPTPELPDYMYYIIGTLAAVVFILFVIIACMCVGKRRRIMPPRYSKFGSLSVNG